MNVAFLTLILKIACVDAQLAAPTPPITAMTFSPDGKQLLVGSQAGIQVLSWPDLKPGKHPKTELSHVHDLVFSPDGKTLLAAGGSPAVEGAVEIYLWPEMKLVQRVAPHKDLVYRVAWSPDGSRWATASADGTCRVLAANSWKSELIYEGHSRAVLALVFLPDGKSIVSAGVDQTLQVWEATTAKTLRILDNHVAAVNDLAVRPRGKGDVDTMIASVSEDRTIRLWQPNTGRLIRFIKLKSTPRAVAWHPDGSRLIVGCNDGRLRTLDPNILDVVSDQFGLASRIQAIAIDPKTNHITVAGSGLTKVLP